MMADLQRSQQKALLLEWWQICSVPSIKLFCWNDGRFACEWPEGSFNWQKHFPCWGEVLSNIKKEFFFASGCLSDRVLPICMKKKQKEKGVKRIWIPSKLLAYLFPTYLLFFWPSSSLSFQCDRGHLPFKKLVTFKSHWTKSPTLFDRGDLINLRFRSYLIPSSLSFNVIVEANPSWQRGDLLSHWTQRSTCLTGGDDIAGLKGRKVKRRLFFTIVARHTYIRTKQVVFSDNLWLLYLSCEQTNLEWYLTVIMWLSYLLKKKQEEEEEEQQQQAKKKKNNKQQLFRFTYLYIKKKCITMLQQRIGRSKQTSLQQHTRVGTGMGEHRVKAAAPTSPAHHAGRMDGVWTGNTFALLYSCPIWATTVVSYVLTIHICMYVCMYVCMYLPSNHHQICLYLLPYTQHRYHLHSLPTYLPTDGQSNHLHSLPTWPTYINWLVKTKVVV